MLDIIINNEIVNSGEMIGRNEHGFVSTATHNNSKFEGQTPKDINSALIKSSHLRPSVLSGRDTEEKHNQTDINSAIQDMEDTAKMDMSIEEELARVEEYVNSKILDSKEQIDRVTFQHD